MRPVDISDFEQWHMDKGRLQTGRILQFSTQ